jgi:type IV pilus assembly protein PilC
MKLVPVFTRQLAAMLSSGMPIVQTLDALESQTENKLFKNVIAGVRSQIEGGASLSDALRRYPDVFEELYVSMIEAGETGGLLADTAGRLAMHLEAQAKLRRKVISAMMYPAIVTLVALLLTSAMIIWIVPAFASIYEDFDAALPGPTQFLVNVSDFVRAYALYVFGTLTALFILIARMKKTEKGAYLWDGLMLRLPIFGDLISKVSLSRFSSTFAQLTRSGVPILQALEITSVATGNKVIGKVISDAGDVVERGEPLSSALAGNRNYPAMLVQMLSAGEQTGKVDEMLTKIAEFYDDEVDATLAGLTSLIEPLLIVFLGLVIGGIVLCMFMPIFKMHEIVAF